MTTLTFQRKKKKKTGHLIQCGKYLGGARVSDVCTHLDSYFRFNSVYRSLSLLMVTVGYFLPCLFHPRSSMKWSEGLHVQCLRVVSCMPCRSDGGVHAVELVF